jgi:hypothetical protein
VEPDDTLIVGSDGRAAMLQIDVFGAVLVVAVIVLAVLASRRRPPPPALEAPTNTELARAVRLLDRILAVDEAFPQLPTELRDEAKRITATYYRELEE